MKEASGTLPSSTSAARLMRIMEGAGVHGSLISLLCWIGESACQLSERAIRPALLIRRTGLAIGTREYDPVAIGILEPDLSMIGAATAVGRIPMRCQDDLGWQLRGPGHGGIEILDLKPQQHAVAIGTVIRITHRAVIMVHFPVMELHDQGLAIHEPLVLRTTVVALTAKQSLIPSTRCFDVRDGNERLWAHDLGSRGEVDARLSA